MASRASLRAAGVLGVALALWSGCARSASEDESRGASPDWQVDQSRAAAGVALQVRLDRDQITTAEWLLLEVAVSAAEGSVVRLPAAAELEVPAGDGGALSVERMQTQPPELLADGRVRWVRRFELQPFLAGAYVAPGLTVAVTGPAGDETLLHSDPIPVVVLSVLDAGETTPQPREVRDPVAVAPRLQHVLLLSGLGLAAAGAGAATIVVARRRSARLRVRAAIVPPHEAALRALRELAAGDLPEHDLLAFHHAVAAVVRTFLEQRFGVRAPERTTEELMLILAEAQWLDDFQRRSLHTFLTCCDQVKFAGARPDAGVSRALIDTAGELVTALRPERSQEEAAVAV